MTEQELIDLCKEPKRRKVLFWTSEIYGFGPILRKFGFYPDFLPLNIYFSHGVTMHDKPAPHELDNQAPVILFFSPRLVDSFKKASSKLCYCVLSPNVYFRRKQNLKQITNAKGTLAFFAHTTPVIDSTMDVSLYIHQLKSLPEKYQPVSICLHYHDVNKVFYKLFIEEKMNVMTVGHPFREDFIIRFYEMISQFKYLTSNEIGSYSFYGPEMGIPFFLYGTESELINRGDSNIEAGIYNSFKQTEKYKETYTLFMNAVDEVTMEQRKMVESELGVYDSISRVKFSYILYKSYFLYVFSKVKSRLAKRFLVF